MANEKRLIDANELLSKMHRLDEKQKTDVWMTCDIESLLEMQPTVDAVEVVRCGTCVHFAETKGKDSGKPCGYGKCMKPFFIQMIVDADDFCSYGERREE